MVYSITGAALNVNDNRNGFRISNLTIKQPITTTKNLLKYYNIEMSPWRFKVTTPFFLFVLIKVVGRRYAGRFYISIFALILFELAEPSFLSLYLVQKQIPVEHLA
jgi:hypothetical protein